MTVCDLRSCPAKALTRFVFTVGELDFCRHHGNEVPVTLGGLADVVDLEPSEEPAPKVWT